MCYARIIITQTSYEPTSKGNRKVNQHVTGLEWPRKDHWFQEQEHASARIDIGMPHHYYLILAPSGQEVNRLELLTQLVI